MARTNTISQLAFDMTEQGFVPDIVIRRGIRHLLKQRLIEIKHDDIEASSSLFSSFVEQLKTSDIALLTQKANEQHYEVPASFFEEVLGSHLKYSCAYWPDKVSNLHDAEHAALTQTCLHADLQDGQDVLEMGCGWGSLTLWMASHYPNSTITAVSNSHSQREFIEARAASLNLENIKVITCDMNDFDIEEASYDRVVSVEMFEHMRNWEKLYQNISRWLRPGGKFFKHIFVTDKTPYLFEDNDESDWMSRHFFSGGMMPSDDLPLAFQSDLKFVQRWRWNGQHYEKTCNAWLENMDNNREVIRKIFAETYGENQVQVWWQRWRIFFMACAELFAYNKGQVWWVSHYLFEKP